MSAAEPQEWKVSMGAGHRKRQAIVVLAALFCGFIGFSLTRSLLVSLVGVVAVMAGCIEMFLPCSYKLDDKGATAKIGLSVSFIAWPDVRREIEDEGGVRLSPLPTITRLERFRGVYLRTSGNRDLVLSTIRQFRQTNGSDDT